MGSTDVGARAESEPDSLASHPRISLTLAALSAVQGSLGLYAVGDVSVPSFVAGLSATLFVAGPVAYSTPGRNVWSWYAGLDYGGWCLVTVAVAAAGYAAVSVVGPPPLVLLSAIVGILFGMSCYFLHRVLSDRVGDD